MNTPNLKVLTVLITISQANNPHLVRITSDEQATMSRGAMFEPAPFDLTLPNDKGNCRIIFNNIDWRIINAIRDFEEPPTVLIETVLAEHPDSVVVSYNQHRLIRLVYDNYRVEGILEH